MLSICAGEWKKGVTTKKKKAFEIKMDSYRVFCEKSIGASAML